MISSENVPADARACPPVPYSSFSRNEGVPGSSPGVGFSGLAGIPLQGLLARLAFGYRRVRELRIASRARRISSSAEPLCPLDLFGPCLPAARWLASSAAASLTLPGADRVCPVRDAQTRL